MINQRAIRILLQIANGQLRLWSPVTPPIYPLPLICLDKFLPLQHMAQKLLAPSDLQDLPALRFSSLVLMLSDVRRSPEAIFAISLMNCFGFLQVHSQRTITSHPAFFRNASFLASRSAFLRIFGVQYSFLLAGRWPTLQLWPCQKQPRT